jgi:hypothetical protein
MILSRSVETEVPAGAFAVAGREELMLHETQNAHRQGCLSDPQDCETGLRYF